jgi:uncharacterized protein (DUF1684 family)
MRQLLGVIILLLCLFRCTFPDDYTEQVLEHRQNIDELFADEKRSPLSDEDRLKFTALAYFPVDKAYLVGAHVRRFDSAQYVDLKHTLNRTYRFIRWGIADFKLLNDSCHLTIFQNTEKAFLFVPFKDYTTGNETYSGGRYLDLELPKDSFITIDFNLAYNPDCAYNDFWSCPLVPKENILALPVKAGVKKFSPDRK